MSDEDKGTLEMHCSGMVVHRPPPHKMARRMPGDAPGTLTRQTIVTFSVHELSGWLVTVIESINKEANSITELFLCLNGTRRTMGMVGNWHDELMKLVEQRDSDVGPMPRFYPPYNIKGPSDAG